MNKFLYLLFIPILSCGVDSPPSGSIEISPKEAYTSIINNLDPLYPGRGVDVFDDKKLDRPMAYGLILSAESNRYCFEEDSTTLDRIRKTGQWLINNSDINGNGIAGYGLADAWDAFSDSSVNPAHQEYTITTAIAIGGLIDWYNIEPDSSLKNQISVSIWKSLSPYIDSQYYSPIGIPAYSLGSNDQEYDVYNPAAYLAGQFKKFSKIVDSDSLSHLLNEKSDHIIDVVLANSQTDLSGNEFWNYGIHIKRPNDMVHACYIVEGIRENIDSRPEMHTVWPPIYSQMDGFYSKHTWFEHVQEDRQNEKLNCRLWALGMLMYTLSKEEEYERIESSLWPQIMSYHLGDGQFKFKANDETSMIRQDAHLLLGLSYYLYNNQKFKKQQLD